MLSWEKADDLAYRFGVFIGYNHDALMWATIITIVVGLGAFPFMRAHRRIYFFGLLLCWPVSFFVAKLI